MAEPADRWPVHLRWPAVPGPVERTRPWERHPRPGPVAGLDRDHPYRKGSRARLRAPAAAGIRVAAECAGWIPGDRGRSHGVQQGRQHRRGRGAVRVGFPPVPDPGRARRRASTPVTDPHPSALRRSRRATGTHECVGDTAGLQHAQVDRRGTSGHGLRRTVPRRGRQGGRGTVRSGRATGAAVMGGRALSVPDGLYRRPGGAAGTPAAGGGHRTDDLPAERAAQRGGPHHPETTAGVAGGLGVTATATG